MEDSVELTEVVVVVSSIEKSISTNQSILYTFRLPSSVSETTATKPDSVKEASEWKWIHIR